MLSVTFDICSRAWKAMVPLHAVALPYLLSSGVRMRAFRRCDEFE
jgi:hypothetical protein